LADEAINSRQEESLPLHDLLQVQQSTPIARRDKYNDGGNCNVCNDDNGHGDDSESKVISGDGDAKHDNGDKQVPAAAEVKPH